MISLAGDLAGATAAIQIDGQAETWTLSREGVPPTSQAALGDGSHTLTVTADSLDLVGTGLVAPFSITIAVGESSSVAYQALDERVAPNSLVGSSLGFQGHPEDPTTGLIYVRNRYLDPEMGRWITADPLGYVDGPAMHAAFGNDPVNKRDPLGLYQTDFHFYAVFYMGLLALDFDYERALRIAYASQYVDDWEGTRPVTMDAVLNPGAPSYQRRLRNFHFPHKAGGQTVRATDDPSGLAAALVRYAVSTGDDMQLGVALHTLADSFSHEGYSWEVTDLNKCASPLS